MTLKVKICGLTTHQAVTAAADADYIGFVFFPRSPRNLLPAQAAGLAACTDIPSVAVTVDPGDHLLRDIFDAFRPDYIQLHGEETVERIQQIRQRFETPVIKALRISCAEDIEAASKYETVADMLMFDAAHKEGMPGGNGIAFDWKMLAAARFTKPWFLSGGLTQDNIEQAVRVSGARMVDISSALESAPGVKDPVRVREFIRKAKSLPL